ncbi:hypothetical protein MUK42_10936 [Musa troglodytarum]|uniref:Uncharacterized protein n=1 Tax=Musa troglodytarum TaxID=320322 RepID=A0A9E7GJB9_9LILI|nr:hypothetical protein MUK42_10936 [Musa troglodytarum]
MSADSDVVVGSDGQNDGDIIGVAGPSSGTHEHILTGGRSGSLTGCTPRVDKHFSYRWNISRVGLDPACSAADADGPCGGHGDGADAGEAFGGAVGHPHPHEQHGHADEEEHEGIELEGRGREAVGLSDRKTATAPTEIRKKAGMDGGGWGGPLRSPPRSDRKGRSGKDIA